jgi:Xaa-Pro dipeptidase
VTDSLIAQRISKLRARLAAAPFDAFLAVSAANVLYATGYRSLGASVHGIPSMGALVGGDRTVVVGPVADSAPATDSAIAVDDYVPYGRFYFESATELPPAFAPDAHVGFVDAMVAAVASCHLSSAAIGVDEAALNPSTLAQLSVALPDVRFVDASSWALRVRAAKLAGEVELLERSARLAEDGVAAAIGAAPNVNSPRSSPATWPPPVPNRGSSSPPPGRGARSPTCTHPTRPSCRATWFASTSAAWSTATGLISVGPP